MDNININKDLVEQAKKDARLREAMTSNDVDAAERIYHDVQELQSRIDFDEEEELWNQISDLKHDLFILLGVLKSRKDESALGWLPSEH